MYTRLAALEAEFDKLEVSLQDVYASGDQDAIREAGKRHSVLEPVVAAYRAYRQTRSNLEEAKALLPDAQGDDREYLRSEIETSEERLEQLEADLKLMLLPRDPNDDKNVIMEIRGAEGGEEANLFAGDLFQMYQRYAEARGWKFEVLSSQPSDMGGYKEITFVVRGDGAWSRLKHEAGPHRVQRVPVTESQGRIHTSAATVVVLPEAQEIDIRIDPADLEFDVFRSTGPGGQSVNTTDSAVRVTHKPSGLVVSCQDEKSQLQNKDKALRILRSRLLRLEQDRAAAERSSTKRAQVGGGGRSEKIRTYNFKENRVTDHRIGLTAYRLDEILQGDLDDFVDALVAAERAEQLAGAGVEA